MRIKLSYKMITRGVLPRKGWERIFGKKTHAHDKNSLRLHYNIGFAGL